MTPNQFSWCQFDFGWHRVHSVGVNLISYGTQFGSVIQSLDICSTHWTELLFNESLLFPICSFSELIGNLWSVAIESIGSKSFPTIFIWYFLFEIFTIGYLCFLCSLQFLIFGEIRFFLILSLFSKFALKPI